MKILYVITKANWGGAQKYVFDLATHLPRPEFEAVVAYGEGNVLPTKLKEAGIRSIPVFSLGRDMHIFKVSPQLQHRVTATTGVFPRTAAAGWFTDKPYTGFKF